MNVALVKLSSLGDVVHALPVAVALRTRRGGTRITWIVEAREAAVLQGHEAIDEILAVDTRRWRRARGPADLVRAMHELVALRRRLRGACFDAVLDLQGLLKSGLVSAATGAPLRVGFAAARCREPLSALFSNRHVAPAASVGHVVDQYLAVLVALGIPGGKPQFRIPVDPGAAARMDGALAALGVKPRDRLVVVNPGAGRVGKRWPFECYRELVRRLREEAAATTVVVWGPGERETAQAIAAGGTGAVLAPPTSIPELAGLLRRATTVVAGDTGPLHLAAAVGTPCVGLYGPTRAERNGPYGPGHRTLQSADGTMTSIPVSAVLAATADLLG
jgi:lipopolysaccharide heptosyltransferase I